MVFPAISLCHNQNGVSFSFYRHQQLRWKNVKVGDVLRLENNDFITVGSAVCIIHWCMCKVRLRKEGKRVVRDLKANHWLL